MRPFRARLDAAAAQPDPAAWSLDGAGSLRPFLAHLRPRHLSVRRPARAAALHDVSHDALRAVLFACAYPDATTATPRPITRAASATSRSASPAARSPTAARRRRPGGLRPDTAAPFITPTTAHQPSASRSRWCSRSSTSRTVFRRWPGTSRACRLPEGDVEEARSRLHLLSSRRVRDSAEGTSSSVR